MSVAHRETPLLEVRNVSKSYPVSGGFWRKKRQPVLRDVNLTLSEGSSVGLIGESGGGKSTLGRLILGLVGSYSWKAALFRYGARNILGK